MFRAFLALAVTANASLVWTPTPTADDTAAWAKKGYEAAGVADKAAYDALVAGSDADKADKIKKYTDAYGAAQKEWEKANPALTPTADQIKDIDAAAKKTLSTEEAKAYDDYVALTDKSTATKAQTDALAKFTTAQQAELKKWAADQSAGFAVAAAGAMLAAAALF